MFGLFKHNDVLGVDIGTTSVKIVEIRKRGKIFELANYGILEKFGHLERVNDAIQTSNFKLLEESTALLIQKLLKELKPKTQDAYVSLPAFSSFVSLIELPIMSKKEIGEAIKYQAGQYIPMPLKDVTLDWNLVEQINNKIKVLLVAIPTDTIKRYIKTAKLAKLNLKEIELETIAVARLIGKKHLQPLALVDIGGRSTSISIVKDGKVRLLHTIDTAGGDLTQVIASGLSINPMRAEKLKRAYGLHFQNRGDIDILRLLIPLLDVIKRETEKAINNYYIQSKITVDQVFLTGGGSCLRGIEEYYSKALSLPVKKIDPFSDGFISYNPLLAPVIRDIGPTLTTACAIAFRR